MSTLLTSPSSCCLWRPVRQHMTGAHLPTPLRWRLFKVHNFAVKADHWPRLSQQKVNQPQSDVVQMQHKTKQSAVRCKCQTKRKTVTGVVAGLVGLMAQSACGGLTGCQVCIGTHASVERMHWVVQMANRCHARHASPPGGRVPSPSPSSSRTWNSASPRPSSSTSATATQRSGTRLPSTSSTPSSSPRGGPATPQLARRLAHLVGVLASIPCESPHVVMGNLLTLRPVEMTGWRESLRYPQNLARNTAKVGGGGTSWQAGCATNYTIVPDADMIPGNHPENTIQANKAKLAVKPAQLELPQFRGWRSSWRRSYRRDSRFVRVPLGYVHSPHVLLLRRTVRNVPMWCPSTKSNQPSVMRPHSQLS